MAVSTSTPNDLMVVFSNTITQGFAALAGPVDGVFATMIAPVVGLTGIQWALSPNREVLASAVGKILLIGAFAWLINDWQALSQTVYQGFLQLGLTAGGGGTTAADFFNPGAVLEEGWTLVKAMGAIQLHANGPLDIAGNITDALILAIAMIGVILSFAVTEPDAGTDTTRISTFARREGDHYVVSGQKIWISRAEHSDLMVLLCRTTQRDAGKRSSNGMSVLLVDMREAVGRGLTIRPIRTMLNHATTELFFDNLEVPAENLIGQEGEGFRYILDGMNAERILIASECIGDGRFFIDHAATYARDRKVFGRPIGGNQGVQFPIARAYVQLQAAALMVDHASALFEAGQACGTQANMAKTLASEASWYAADQCLQTHGGFGFAEEYDIERKFRETRLYQVAPISTNLILSHVATNALGIPKPF